MIHGADGLKHNRQSVGSDSELLNGRGEDGAQFSPVENGK